MSAESIWTHVGRLADVLQILTVVGGLAFVALAIAGVDVLADPSNQTLLLAAVVLGLSALLALGTGVTRAQLSDSGFREGDRTTNQVLYATSAVLFALSATAVSLLIFREPPTGASTCLTGV